MAKKPGTVGKGNQLAKKLKTPDLKEEAYHQYCDWIASGKSKKSWTFDHPHLSLTWETMEKYIREDPSVFDPNKQRQAESASLKVWEQSGYDMMTGKIEKCQPAIYQMFMRNKFGWDKESHVTHSLETDVRKLLSKWEK